MYSIICNDINIAYTDQGEGETVLLLHGLGSCKTDWQPQIKALTHHYRVIAPDLRGHGATDKPSGGYNIPQFAADVFNLLDALGCQQVHMIGLSLGGMITLEFATRYPQRLHSITIINATPSVVLDNWQIRRFFWVRLLMIRLFGPASLGRKIAQYNFPAPAQAEQRRQAEKQFGSNNKAAYFHSTKALLNWDIRPRLAYIPCPLLAISSDMDYTPVATKQALVDAVPNGKLHVIHNARHLLPMEHPGELNAVLLDWLQQTHSQTI